MNKAVFSAAGALVIMLSGCASSDRMARMSGGVLDEYSAPPSYRLRSKKFQQKSKALDPAKRANSPDVAGLDDTLINIWPFFFRNDSYWTALWPLVDVDKYGMAIRPFYVQDGDEHAILFPLSGWNSVSKSGWIANFAWNQNSFGMIPLFWHNKEADSGWFYYTPFLIHNYNLRPLTRDNLRRDNSFTEILLAYRSKKTEAITGEWAWLFNTWWYQNNIKNHPVLRYHFSKLGKPVPQTMKELNKFRESVFQTLPQKQGGSFGFFPLFNMTDEPNGNSSFYLFPYSSEKRKNDSEWKLLFGILAKHKNQQINHENGLWAWGKKTCFIPPLLTGTKEEIKYQNTGTMKILRDLASLESNSRPYNQNFPRINELLKKLDPGLKLPDYVTDYQTLDLFLNDWRKGKEFPVEISKKGGNPLIYLYEIKKDFVSHISPILLTGYEKSPAKTTFWSFPLMTFRTQKQNSGFFGILPPLAVMDFYEKEPASFQKKIHTSNAKTSAKWDVVEEKNRYLACGLFYQGKIAFNVAKNGIDSKLLEQIRSGVKNSSIEYSNIQKAWKALEKDRQRNNAWKTNGKIEYYKKLIREEELKIQEENLKNREKKYQKTITKLKQDAESIQFQIAEAELQNPAAAEQAIRRLVANYTELRWKEDIGNGLIFRKEKFYNGDYSWNLLGFLAGGDKTGTKENTRVLHMVYRHRKDGARSETLFFPFVSIQKDGEDSQFSFLWRLFQLRKEKGKTSGYFCFIPFG